MSRRRLLILVAIWNIFFLYMGFPSSWDKVLAIISGVLIIIIAYKSPPNMIDKVPEQLSFVEHNSKDNQ